jgi:D-sedoheptulose 7-phosphate isomerase
VESKNLNFIKDYFLEMVKVIGNISHDDIDKIIDILFDAWKNGRQVFACGNGGSASTATHFVCDLSKTTIVGGKKRFKAIGLNDNTPLVSAITNDEGFDNLFYEQLVNHFRRGDVLVCFSVHGGVGQDKAGLWSQNLLKALKYAQDNGGKAIGFSGFDGGALKEMADACITVPADSTPQVESFHLALEHLICNCLKEKIEGVK